MMRFELDGDPAVNLMKWAMILLIAVGLVVGTLILAF